MENKKNNNIVIAKKKILSLICLIIFSLAFVFACLKSVLPVGNIIACTFGIMTYPLFLFLSLIELAKFLGLSYKRSAKSTFYFLLIIISLLFVIQAITTYKQLSLVASIKSLKTYLKFSYNSKITLVGSFGSIFVGLTAILLGAMGTIVAFVITLTISIGLLIDYENYGKFEDVKIKSLPNAKIRNQVNNSDKNVDENGKPDFTFSNNDSVIDTIEVDEDRVNNTINVNDDFPKYKNNDILGETTIDYGGSDEYIDNTANEPNFPTTDNDLRDRRGNEFLNNTFGNFGNNNIQPSFPGENSYPTFPIGNNDDTYDNDDESEISDTDGIDLPDYVKNKLNGEEIDVGEIATTQNGFNGFTNNIPTNQTGFVPEQIENPWENLRNNEFINIDPQPITPYRPEPPKPIDIDKRNSGILTTNAKPTEIDIIKPKIPNAKPIGMRGIRYNPPMLSLLNEPIPDTGDYSEEQSRKSNKLEEVLKSFGIPANVVKIVRGPKITRYELSVPLGTSVKKIPAYDKDIQTALAANTITIEAPIPGTNNVGIELENDTFSNVTERELLASPEFRNAKDPLPIAIGKDISGKIIVKSLTKMVHTLVAGSTGSGKSVFIHNIVLSLIYKYGPDDLRLVMIDPKRVEFGIYNGLPHLVTPSVVLGLEKAVTALKWCVNEMDRRYDLMNKAGYKNIESYNKSEAVKSGTLEHFPYIVIIVDELAEIMINHKKDAEPAIQRITQLARASGMYLVVAVQRPSVDIITGVIKNNIGSRIAFRLQSGADSKTMLGTVGAEKLLGKGDMLLQLSDTCAIPRLQAAFATDEEIKEVIDFIKNNNTAVYDENIQTAFDANPQQSGDSSISDGGFVDVAPADNRLDELFKVSVKAVMANGSAATSYLQRRFSIGYCRAAKIIDQMAQKGFISAPGPGGKRQILISPDQFRDEFGEEYNS